MRTEPCVCGGYITATEGLEPEAVTRHNMSLMHVVWRSKREASTAEPVVRDLSERAICASAPIVRKVS